MTTYFLHGGYLKKQTDSNAAFYRRVSELTPDVGTVLFVYFAARPQERSYEELFTAQKAQMEEGAKGKSFTYVCATPEGFLDELKAADTILIRGGSTNRLLEVLRKYPDLKPLFEGKVVGGSSAGAYAISAFNYEKGKQAIRMGMNWLPVRVLCHYQSEDPENTTGDDAVALMNSAHEELPLVILKDCEWKEFSV